MNDDFAITIYQGDTSLASGSCEEMERRWTQELYALRRANCNAIIPTGGGKGLVVFDPKGRFLYRLCFRVDGGRS